jgi:hypothetical protein
MHEAPFKQLPGFDWLSWKRFFLGIAGSDDFG